MDQQYEKQPLQKIRVVKRNTIENLPIKKFSIKRNAALKKLEFMDEGMLAFD
jgi:hypothetical protein